jgi:hypothetical protein
VNKNVRDIYKEHHVDIVKIDEECIYILLGPALAIDKIPFPTCFNEKFSSLNLLPYILFPPVPLWLVKSPPWHINCGITRWNVDPLNPNPGSPVQSARKFSAVMKS